MSLRKDLPAFNFNAHTSLMPPGVVMAAGRQGEARSVMEALETVGSQVREYRNAVEAKLSGTQAEINTRLVAIEQIVASNQSIGGFGASAAAPAASAVLDGEGNEVLVQNLRNGKAKSARFSLETFHRPNAAIVTSGDGFAVPQRDTEIYGSLSRRVSVRDLLVTRPTTAASIEYLKGTRTGAAATQAAEGGQKAELAIDFALTDAKVRTIAVWIPASRQALDDIDMLRDYIDIELYDALRLAEDGQLLKGSGVGENIGGLWTNAIEYNRAQAGDTPNDTLRRAITQVQLARGVATGIVINPEGLEDLELEKDGEGRYLVSYAVTDANGRTQTWRVPVVVTDSLEADEFLVGDFNRAARLYDRLQANIEIANQHADFFTRNLVAILAEERVALTIPRPDMLVKGTFQA